MLQSFGSALLAILAIGLLIAVHEYGHFLAARLLGMKVVRFSIGFFKPIARWQRGETEYSLGILPLGGYVQVLGMNPFEEGALDDPRSYARKPRWARALVCFAGPLFSYGLGVLGFFLFFFGGQTRQEVRFEVSEVVEGSAAAIAGVQSGDVILALDDTVPASTDAFGTYIDAHAGQAVRLQLVRGETPLEVTAQLPPQRTDKGMLGIRYQARPNLVDASVGIGTALDLSLDVSWRQTQAIMGALGRLFTKPTEVEVGGAPEIVRQLKKSAERGLLDFLWLVASLSIMFGLFNVLPVPALDGSKMLVLGVEGVVRRDVPARLQVAVHGVGFLLLMGLMVVTSVGDIWKWVR